MSDVQSMTKEKMDELAELCSRTIKKKRAELWPWAQKADISCFRLFDRDIPDVPFVIDEYDKHLHLSQSIKPKNLSDELQDYWTESIKNAAARALGTPLDRVFMKARRGQKEGQYQKLDDTQKKIVVTEYGLKFIVNLTDYIDTGLFLDHRDTRQLVQSMALGARVLNLFSYTGSFSVYAASGGSQSTISVDLSNTYTEWASENLALNGYKNSLNQTISGDVYDYLQTAIKQNKTFDIIILDPPTFSNSKKMTQTLDVQRDHPLLINQCLRLLSSKGILIFSNNLRTFKLDEHAINTHYIDDITFKTTPQDFKKRHPHFCYVLKKPR